MGSSLTNQGEHVEENINKLLVAIKKMKKKIGANKNKIKRCDNQKIMKYKKS